MKKIFETEPIDNKIELSDKYIQLEAQYVQTSISSNRYISKYQYSKALDSYGKCYNLALQLKDKNKMNDSLCNLAITYFYIGDTKTSLEKFLNLYKYYNDNEEDENKTINERKVKLKVFSNLIIVYISLGKIEEAKDCLEKLIIFINNEENENDDINHKLISLKEVLNIFFRLDSLIDVDKYKSDDGCLIKENEKSASNNYGEIIYKLINTFYLFLHTNDIDQWIKCLQDTVENFKLLKDYNGLLFSIYNLHSSLYNKGKIRNDISLIDSSKNKIKALIQILVGNNEINDQDIEGILDGIKKKMEFSIQLYKQLLSLERDIIKSNNKNKRKNNVINSNVNSVYNTSFIKLLLKFSLKYFDKSSIDESVSSKLKNYISNIIEQIENNNITLSDLQITNISPEIINGFENLFINLKIVLAKITGKYLFKQLLNINKQGQIIFNDNKIVLFQGENYQSLLKGQEFEKINYRSGGTKSYYYLFNYDLCAIVRYKHNSKHPDQTISLREISKIKFGIYSNNLIKKLSNNNDYIIKPWTYLSLITMKRSIDLHSFSDNIDCWYYGLFHYFNKNNMKSKIISSSMFLLRKLKGKTIYKLMEATKNKNQLNSQVIEKIKKLYTDECFNVQKHSFVKCLLFFKEIYNL